ncbi:MAG TPA: FmdB family zinc ribbon protein [Methylomirabilota bacterium]|nr:FmdB family zinc ribbon protein [Methylomirabilota bacterium]
MPTYEYQCDQCHRTFEVRQRITAEPLTRCEACGGTLKRLISPAPFILKGEGWYVTDYPSEARKKAVESEKSSAGKSPSGEQSSTPAPKETPTASSSAAAPSSPAAASSD